MRPKIHIFTIVLNGMPFIRHHIEIFEKLSGNWHWHIVEGAADLKHDTGWSLINGGSMPEEVKKTTLSTDGTTEYIDELTSNYPNRITVYRKPKGELWNGKLEMVQAPLAEIKEECLLWQIDVDEFWTADQIEAVSKAFTQHPSKTAAWYWCNFYVGPEAVVSTRNCYSQNPAQEWLRTWHFKPGDQWLAHEPPTLVRTLDNGREADLGKINPFLHDETERLGAVFNHHAYVLESQVTFKETYYGYAGAVKRWLDLQHDLAVLGEAQLGLYYPWVDERTRVKFLGSAPSPRYSIVVDGVFYEHSKQSGIARVWKEILERWSHSEVAADILLIDRNRTAPEFEGIRKVHLPCWELGKSAAEAMMIDKLCRQVQAKVFISSYYSGSVATPSVMLLHDMIPEVLAAGELVGGIWAEKNLCIGQASHVVCVSQNTRNDLIRLYGEQFCEHSSVAHLGVGENFRQCSDKDIQSFRERRGLDKPYLLFVGDRTGLLGLPGGEGYKNVLSAVMEIAGWERASEFEILCVGGRDPVEPAIIEATGGKITIRRIDVSDEELSLVYGGAFAMIHPSLYEGFGLPIIEAMASGCAVVSSNRSSLPEVGGGAALYYDPATKGSMLKCIDFLLENQFRNELINRGRKHATQFRWEVLAEHLLAILVDKEHHIPMGGAFWKALRINQYLTECQVAVSVKPLEEALSRENLLKNRLWEYEILNRSKYVKIGQYLGICHRPKAL